jgi:integrase
MFGFLFQETLDHFFYTTYLPRRLLTASPKTIAVYEVTLRHFRRYLGKKPLISHLNDDCLAGFVSFRLQEDKISRSTAKRDMDALLALFRQCHALGKLKRGPSIRAIHVPTPTPTAWTREELEALFAAAQTETISVAIAANPRVDVPGNIWWPPFLSVMWDSAERLGAVFDLMEEDLDWIHGTATFKAETRKGQTADNVQKLQADTWEVIQRLLLCYPKRQSNSRVFRWAMNRGGIFNRFGAICDRAGVRNKVGKKFHTIRSSRATHELLAGGDPTSKLCHSSDVVTRKHYIDPRLMKEKEVVVFSPGKATG